MGIATGHIDQTPVPDHWGRQDSHMTLIVELFSGRLAHELSGMGRSRARDLRNSFFDYRSARIESPVLAPIDKLRGSIACE